ncbi:MAG: hypothetical protein QF637_04905 [Acidimicrobiales bacterium]|jgi:hypothetical protein|nr:hypothetical protein [Acidimicrobiales bacterium]
MEAMPCPHCDTPLDKVLDLPYGYWQWDGERYVLATTAETVDVAPWVCINCLTSLRKFHPQDITTATLNTE